MRRQGVLTVVAAAVLAGGLGCCSDPGKLYVTKGVCTDALLTVLTTTNPGAGADSGTNLIKDYVDEVTYGGHTWQGLRSR